MVKRAGPVLFLVLMYRKLFFFFSLVNYLQVWWAGLAHWRVTTDIGVCSWEEGMERLTPDWHQYLELAISFLRTLIFWELFSPNSTASHLLFSLVVAECLFLSLQNNNNNKKTSQKHEKKPFTKEPIKLFLPLALYVTKILGLEKKGFCF